MRLNDLKSIETRMKQKITLALADHCLGVFQSASSAFTINPGSIFEIDGFVNESKPSHSE
jgi:hypothetical protein